MIPNVTFTMTSTGTGILWLFLLTLLVSFMVSHIKCKDYNCSIKYSLLISIILAIIYSIIFIWTMPSVPPEIKNTFLFSIIIIVALIFIALIPNIVLGVIGGSFAVFLKRSSKSKGVTSKEISEKLKKRRIK